MNTIDKILEYQKVLNTPEKTVIYIILYAANAKGETLSAQKIKESAEKKYDHDIEYTKVLRTLKYFEDEEIVSKTETRPMKFQLIKTMYNPFGQSPLRIYQLALLLITGAMAGYANLFTNDIILKTITATSALTIFGIILINYALFEISNSQILSDISISKLHNLYSRKLKKVLKSEVIA